MLFACDATNCRSLCKASQEQKNFKHAKTNNSLNVDYFAKPANLMRGLRTEAMNMPMGTQSTAAPGDSPDMSPMSSPLDSLTNFSPVHRLGLCQGSVYRDLHWSVDGSSDLWGLPRRPAQSSRAQSVPRPRMSHGVPMGMQRAGQPGYEVMPGRSRINPVPPNSHDNKDHWVGEVVATAQPPPPPTDTLSCFTAEGDEVPVDDIKDHVRQIFQVCSPSKVLEVDYLLKKYEGLERELYARICKKYRVLPIAALLPPDSEEEERDAHSHSHETRCIPATNPTDNARLAGFLSDEGFRGVNAHRVKIPVEWCYPLHVAVAMNDANLVQLLLEARGDPSLGDSAGMTPLNLAHEICLGDSGAAVREALGG